MWRDALLGLLELFAPATCIGCDLGMGEQEGPFCDACAPLVEEAPDALRPPAPAAAVLVHAGPVADAIRRMKYGGRSELAAPLGALLVARAAAAYHGRVEAVVPVPLHPRRLRARGFDQTCLLAAPLARALGVPLADRALVRRRETAVQASLPAAARTDNVRAAFAPGDVRRVRGRAVLLFDDVRTTGATLADAARALRQAGAAEVRTLALAAAE